MSVLLPDNAALPSAAYVIAGGGCYGTDYVRQLRKARNRGAVAFERLLIVDRDPACPVATRASEEGATDVVVVTSSWESFVRRWWPVRDQFADAHWVPTPLGPHIVFEWLLRLLNAEQQRWDRAAWPEGRLPEMEFAQRLDSGSLALSHAPGLCPVHCIEPRKCPLTSAARDWEMTESVAAYAAQRGDIDDLRTVQCQHHAWGVGTIPFRQIVRALEYQPAANSETLAVATVSSCHGLVDAAVRSPD